MFCLVNKGSLVLCDKRHLLHPPPKRVSLKASTNKTSPDWILGTMSMWSGEITGTPGHGVDFSNIHMVSYGHPPLQPHMYIYIYTYLRVVCLEKRFIPVIPPRWFLLSLPSLDGTQGRQTIAVLFEVLFACIPPYKNMKLVQSQVT